MNTTLLFFGILLHAGLGYAYYRMQNSKDIIGGAISKPKAWWLFFVLFYYYFFSLWVYFQIHAESGLQDILYAFLFLIFFRFILQIVIMCILKKWTPPLGIAYNILCILIIILSGAYQFLSTLLHLKSGLDLIVLYHLVVLLCILATDSMYAWTFYKIVGSETKGNNAIWYASDKEAKFIQINNKTYWLNFIFFIFLVVELTLILKSLGEY